MLTVTLYTRKECHLCEQVKEDLLALQAEIPHKLVEIDIESDPALLEKYLVEIPVLEVGPYRKKAPFTQADLRMTLGAARDRQDQFQRLGDEGYQERVRKGQQISGADRLSLWVSANYMIVLNLLVFLYIGLPFLAPVLMKGGAELPARVLYTAYSPLCHQLGFRSFFLFGQQAYYPRDAAGVPGVMTFAEATGLDEGNLVAARSFVGDEQLGYKVALCQRDVAIYISILLFGIVFALTGRRIKPLHWAAWLLIGIVPIGLDGFSQLFSQVGLDAIAALIPYRESTPFLRVLTGALFGLTTAWFGIPYMEESMRETRELMLKKFSVVGKS